MPATLNHAIPVLRVTDLERSLAFYVNMLGFKIDWRDEKHDSFASISRDSCNLFLSVGDQGHTGSWLWIGATDVDALHADLHEKKAFVRQPTTNDPRGSRERQVVDADGNVLRFGSDSTNEPIGGWLDMHGVRWGYESDAGWRRSES